MASVCGSGACILALLMLAPALSSAAQAGGFRGTPTMSSMATQEVVSSLRASLQEMLLVGDGAATQRLDRIEASIWQTFQALTKNTNGRLAPRAVRHVVHNFFAKEHGWLVKGLEPHGMQMNVTEVHEVSILQDRAPALVEALLEARRADHGLSLEDSVVMIAALERLIFDESIAILQTAYALNGFSAADLVDESGLHEILRSYLLIFQMGEKKNVTSVSQHQATKMRLAKKSSSWTTLVEFEENAAMNFRYSKRDRMNPFTEPQFPFEVAATIVENLAQDYGKWQNSECRMMHEELSELDADGSGLVPLSLFYSQPESAAYQFTESMDYLRTIGALDESVPGSPKVRIVNYLTGPSNCIASSAYYSVCCLSECEGIMSELEGRIKGPMASPEQLLAAVGNVSSSSDERRTISHGLQDRLRVIAEHHGGDVPLHGRLFAQWLHRAFPRECPYPHVSESSAVLTPAHWSAQNRSATAPKEEREMHIEAAGTDSAELAMGLTVATAPDAVQEIQWSDHEILPLLEPQATGRGTLRGVARVAVQLAMILAVVRAVIAGWGAVRGAAGAKGNGKDKGLALPM